MFWIYMEGRDIKFVGIFFFFFFVEFIYLESKEKKRKE